MNDGSTEKLSIEYVLWIDSYGGGGWIEPKDTREWDLNIVTIGFVIAEDDKTITISASVCVVSGDAHAPIKIPKVAIKDRYEIEFNR